MNRWGTVSVSLISLILFSSATLSLARSVVPLQAVEFRGFEAEIISVEDCLVRVSIQLYSNITTNVNLIVENPDATMLVPLDKVEQMIPLSSGESTERTFDFVIHSAQAVCS